MGIGSHIAEAPSLTTGRTDRVSGDLAVYQQSRSEEHQAEFLREVAVGQGGHDGALFADPPGSLAAFYQAHPDPPHADTDQRAIRRR